MQKEINKGELFVVATPIGNLEDITFRAINILKNVDFILCEDTRVSGNLLAHYEIKKHLISFNAQSEAKKIEKVISELEAGKSVALISDAGTPSISDPGVRLVNEAHKKGIKVSGTPGANAAIFALSISGIPTDSFLFEGFLPQKKGRQKKLKELVEENRTIVLYESPYRIEKLLIELNEYFSSRFISITRELTKKFEEVIRGYPEALLNNLDSIKIKGEFVVIIAPKNWTQEK